MLRFRIFFLMALLSVCRVFGQVERLVVNEIMVGNIDNFVSPAFNFDGWIELYNPTDRDIPLAGVCFSDDPEEPCKWRAPKEMKSVPAGGYRVVWFDSADICNTNVCFNLDSDGGQLFINAADGTNQLTFFYPEAIERCAYACTEDAGDNWSWTAAPTPGATNNTAVYANEQLPMPEVDKDSQLFTSQVIAQVSIPKGVTLRYTTDGTVPTEKNGTVSNGGRFYVSKTTSLRLRYFQDGYLPSRVTSRSYIKRDKDYRLPIVSVIADPKFLYGDSLGILVDGKNGVPGNQFSDKKNWNRNWERPANFSFIDTDGQMKVNQDVDMKVSGAYSRSLSPRPFKLKGNKKHGGDRNLKHPFFSAKPYLRNRTIVMRNGGNENNTRLKDGAMATLTQTGGAYVDLQSYEPAHEFVNGEYKGVLNMREPNNKQYPYGNYGLSTDDIEAFEVNIDSGYIVTAGTGERFERLYQLSQDAAQPDVYEEIRQCLDIDEYIDYMAMYFYVGTNDWPHNNLKGFCAKDGGKYHIVSFDHDFDFGTTNTFNEFASKQNYTFRQLYNLGISRRQEIKFVTLFLNLIKNDDFRRQFIDSYCVMGGSVFEPTRCCAVIDSLAARVEPMMQLEGRSVMSAAASLKNNLANRMPTMMTALRGYSPMKLITTPAQNVRLSSNTDAAKLYINNTEVLTGRFNGQLFAPVTLRAVAPAGYQFDGWQLRSGMTNELVAMNTMWYYYDKGTLSASDDWYMPNVSRTSWKIGRAPFGYGKDGISTTLSYGSDSNNKYPVYYFRKSFSYQGEKTENTRFLMNYVVDDGFIVYINGHEAGRYNMRTDSSPYASSNATGNPDSGQIELPANLFQVGRNVVCVEVHNYSATSSDIYFAAQIGYEDGDGHSNFYADTPEIDLPAGASDLVACFSPVSDEQRKADRIRPVRINEVSAANDTYVNDYYKRKDWIELYNTTSEDIDLTGMYLTDDIGDLHKYRIQPPSSLIPHPSSIIPAHGYRLVWCDGEEPISQLHASFKIPASGTTLALTAADDSWTDYFEYPAHNAEQTVGRYPDGSNDVYLMTIPTIDKANRLSSYAQLLYDTPTGFQLPSLGGRQRGGELSSGWGLGVGSLLYAADRLILRGWSQPETRLTIYTADGQQVATAILNPVDGYATYDTTRLPTGFYLARVADTKGHQVVCKIVK